MDKRIPELMAECRVPGISTALIRGGQIAWGGGETRAGRADQSGYTRGGLVWAGWHIPLFVTGHYAGGPSSIVVALAFTLPAIALHTLWTRWYLRGGSLRPAIIGHSAWNKIIQFPFIRHTTGENAVLWVGDSEVIVVVVAVLVVVTIQGTWRTERIQREESWIMEQTGLSRSIRVESIS